MKTHNSLILLLLGLSSCLLMAFAAQAQLYKWVDEDGQVHYGEQRPSGQDFTTIKEQKYTPPSTRYELKTNDAQKAILDQSEQAKKQKDDAKKQAEYDAQMKEYCTSLRNQLATFNTGRRVREMNSEGEYVYVDDAQRASQVKDLNKRIKEDCQ